MKALIDVGAMKTVTLFLGDTVLYLPMLIIWYYQIIYSTFIIQCMNNLNMYTCKHT